MRSSHPDPGDPHDYLGKRKRTKKPIQLKIEFRCQFCNYICDTK